MLTREMEVMLRMYKVIRHNKVSTKALVAV